MEGKYLRALQNVLKLNRNRSVSEAYENLREFIQSYEKMGMGMEEQVESTGNAREYFPDENIEEIQTVIQEVLSAHSMYDNFGF